MNEIIKISEKISYGLCGLSYELMFITCSTYLVLFCTNTLGVAARSLTFMFLLANVIDAITDIIITSCADKTVTRWGSYRPWILFGGLGLGISLFMLFLAPSFLTTMTAKTVWVYVWYILAIAFFGTSVMCPTYVLGTIMTPDPVQRLSFASARAIGESAGDVLCNALAMVLVLALGGIAATRGWRTMAASFSIIIMISACIGFRGTRERVQTSKQDRELPQISFWKKLCIMAKNKPYLAIICVCFFLTVENPFSASIFSYFCIYNLGHEEWISSLFTICLVVQVATNFIVPKAGNRFSVRGLLVIAAALLICGYGLVPFVKSYSGCLIIMVLRGIGHGLAFPAMTSLVAEATDYVHVQEGVYLPGLCVATATFIVKIATGAGTALTTLSLTWCGFAEAAAVQSESTLLGLRMAFAIIPLICAAFALFIILGAKSYRKGELAKLHDELKERTVQLITE